MKLCLFFTITLIICQYFISQLTIEARPAALKKFSWSIPIHDDYQDDTNEQPVKRKGVGWGKRNNLMLNDHPYAIHENSARIGFDDK